MSQSLAQLADVTFDDVLVDVFAEQPINIVEDLGFINPATAIAH
jgi:hypothetical protein